MDDEFEWDDDNEKHVGAHKLTPEEVEDVFYDFIPTQAYNQGDEKRYGRIGVTDAGRIITVIFTYREGKVRVVTARDATANEKRRYRDS